MADSFISMAIGNYRYLYTLKVPVEKSSIIFIECTELNWNRKYANGFCVSIFLKDMGWYFGVIGKLNNY